MQQQASLEARFEELLGARDALKAMNNKEPYIANQAELDASPANSAPPPTGYAATSRRTRT